MKIIDELTQATHEETRTLFGLPYFFRNTEEIDFDFVGIECHSAIVIFKRRSISHEQLFLIENFTELDLVTEVVNPVSVWDLIWDATNLDDLQSLDV